MDCVQGKYSDCSPPQGRKRLKKENGYQGGGKRLLGRNGEKGKERGPNGMVHERIVLKKIAGDEMVEGWPKWLVDNIPREVLAGLVSKSADSYDKLAKAQEFKIKAIFSNEV
ncbi:hypothetical protein SLEP1_g8568 [Rubroshorea leprosula]|uniref:Uncharacterized protein n=1 Tax=Rubroshorea leprosula TaxID=152421 RepID=A0AAV5I7Q8_9ROSI|nr:hypothetical protein SLEP1_g8568 [Rubroshorea leprosula]